MHFNPYVTVLYGCLLDFVGWRKRTVSFDSDVVGNEGLPEICILYIAFQTTEDKSFIVQAGPPGFCLKMLEPTELNCTSQCAAQTISKCRWGGCNKCSLPNKVHANELSVEINPESRPCMHCYLGCMGFVVDSWSSFKFLMD